MSFGKILANIIEKANEFKHPKGGKLPVLLNCWSDTTFEVWYKSNKSDQTEELLFD